MQLSEDGVSVEQRRVFMFRWQKDSLGFIFLRLDVVQAPRHEARLNTDISDGLCFIAS
jgi:hypothetical protein